MTKRKWHLVLLEVFAICVFLLYISPIVLVVINSAKHSGDIVLNPLGLPSDWGVLFENIKAVVTDRTVHYSSAFISSTIITVGSLITIVLFATMAAWVLVRHKSRFSTLVYFMFVAAMVIPFQVVMYPLVSWFKELGTFLNIPLLRSYPGAIFAYTGFGMSMSVFMFCGFIKGILYEIEEAATIDGCSKWQVFAYIILPMLKPIIVTVIILNGIWIWNDFLLPLMVLGKGNAIQTLPLAVSNFVGAYTKRWDMILTSTFLAILPMLILFLFAQKHIIKGMTEGAIKS